MLSSYIHKYNIPINGILHIGANNCQEQEEYIKLTTCDKIHWVEAIPSIVDKVKKEHPGYNIYQALMTDKDNDIIDLHVSNNNALSSSIFEFDKHKINHPGIHFTNKIALTTTTLDTFYTTKFSSSFPNIIVIDVQGAEVLVFSGGNKTLDNIDLIMSEVNVDYTYANCGLVTELDSLLSKKGFKKVYQRIWDGHTYGDAIYIKSVT